MLCVGCAGCNQAAEATPGLACRSSVLVAELSVEPPLGSGIRLLPRARSPPDASCCPATHVPALEERREGAMVARQAWRVADMARWLCQ